MTKGGGKRWVRTPHGRRPLDKRTAKMVAWLENGVSHAIIAKEFGISQPRVAAIQKYAGIPSRYPSRK